MKTYVKVDNKNLKEIVDFYYSTVMQMAKTGPQFAKILQEIPEIEKKFYSYVQNEISSKKGESVEIDYNLRLSSNQKFIKKAKRFKIKFVSKPLLNIDKSAKVAYLKINNEVICEVVEVLRQKAKYSGGK